MVKPDKVLSMLGNLRGYREKLEKLAALPPQEFLTDFTKVESAKHLLQVSVEACLDIGHHLIADGGYRPAQDSYDTFVILNEAGILPADFLPTLRRMVSFRNRVVHLYWEVDDPLVHDSVLTGLADLDRFARLIAAYLSQETKGE